MNKFDKISTIDTIVISNEIKVTIQEYSSLPVTFHDTDSPSEEETIKRISDADCVLGSWNSKITKKVIDACPNIKYIGICGTSLLNVDVDYITSQGIVLKNVTDYGDEATAEFIFAQLLLLFRGFGKYSFDSIPRELNKQKIGLIGLGAVGRQVASIALGFNMDVFYHSRTRNNEYEQKGLTYLALDDLLSTCNIISLHTPRNLNIIGQSEFDKMPTNSVFINTCIGTVFDMTSFKDWVNHPTHFAIIDNQFYINEIKDLPNVIALPITAGKTKESIGRMGQKVVNNLVLFLNSQ